MLSRNDTGERLQSLLAKLPGVRVAVFGDFCLDAYWIAEAEERERSVETGLPIRRVRTPRYSLGGAGNVVANLIDLGVSKVRAVGAVGTDLFGTELLKLLRARGADASGMLMLPEPWHTMVYAKPCRGECEDNRLDFGAFNEVSQDAADALARSLAQVVADSDIVVLNQQIPAGVSTPAVIERLNRIIADHPRTQFIVDARHRAQLYQGAAMKLNAREAAGLLGVAIDDSLPAHQAIEHARRLSEKIGRAVFLTRGEYGMIVADQNRVQVINGIQIIDRTDPVGAGDTAVAALAAVLGSGGDAVTAATVANIAASITVRKLQTTGTATPAEIMAVASDADYIHAPELADDPRQARYLDGSEIELVDALPDGIQIQHAIFDHDGTLSVLRQGWEQIMEPVMVRAILGPCYANAQKVLYDKVVEASRLFIDRTTGIQTLVQMQGLVQLVRQFGCVPEDQILDEHGYKRIYNEQLLEMVRQRVRKLNAGELEPADFQIKNACKLLHELHQRGVKLYLASGTDEADVIAEAKAMGYANLFEGRIFGAVGDVKIEAKKVVLERIIREHRLSGGQFATFGDGPVEMRETRKRGGICVGVASDEVRRFGFNPSKRARLVRAGASLIVPDFSQLRVLLKLLHFA